MSEPKRLDEETERLIRVLDRSKGGTVAADELRQRIRELVDQARSEGYDQGYRNGQFDNEETNV